MRAPLVTLAASLALLVACGGGGMDSPRAVAEAVVGHLSNADMGGVVKLMPPASTLGDSFDCSAAERDVVDQLERQKAKYIKRGVRKAEKMKGLTYALDAFDLEGSKDTVVAAGEPFEGCVVTKEVVIHSSRMKLEVTKDGQTREESEIWSFIRLDGKWYLAKL